MESRIVVVGVAAMEHRTFIIKSLLVQNGIMLMALGAVIAFLVFALLKKSPKQIVASTVWIIIVLWFFNSPFFGFSGVTVGKEGIELDYGVLSLRNTVLPIGSPWKVETRLSGLRKMKKLYLLRIADRESMKVSGNDGRALLDRIGRAIEAVKGPGAGN